MWSRSSEYCKFEDDEDLETESTAILHPFGRGQFRELAEQAVIPDILLNEFCELHASRRRKVQVAPSTTWSNGMGGAARSKVKEQARPPRVGRAKALRLRAERLEQSSIRPGSPCQHESERSTTMVVLPRSQLDYDRDWPPLKPGGMSEEDSSDIITDGFYSESSTSSENQRANLKAPSFDYTQKRSIMNGFTPVINPVVPKRQSCFREVKPPKKDERCVATSRLYDSQQFSHTSQVVSQPRNTSGSRQSSPKVHDDSIIGPRSHFLTPKTQGPPTEASFPSQEEEQASLSFRVSKQLLNEAQLK